MLLDWKVRVPVERPAMGKMNTLTRCIKVRSSDTSFVISTIIEQPELVFPVGRGGKNWGDSGIVFGYRREGRDEPGAGSILHQIKDVPRSRDRIGQGDRGGGGREPNSLLLPIVPVESDRASTVARVEILDRALSSGECSIPTEGRRG